MSLVGGVAVGCILGVAGAVVFTQSPQQASAGRGTPALPPVTAKVISQRLVDSKDAPCELSAKEIAAVAPISAGRYRQRVVTAVAVTPDDRLSSGSLVAVVSGRPLIAFVTSVPFFRDLKIGDRGADVRGLEEGLVAAGRIRHADDVLDHQTATALTAIYRKAGISVRNAFVADSAWAVPAGSHVTSVTAVVGDVVGRKDHLVTALANSRRWHCRVRGDLPVGAEDNIGARADGRSLKLRITKMTPDPESGDSVLTVEPSVSLKPRANLVATVVTADSGVATLTVPAGAIFGTSGGSQAVRILEDGGTTREVVVQVGIAAQGWVEVIASDLVAGDVVLIRGKE